ncbi:hypothetical protein AB4Z21_34985, partial [Paenibacillus sp. MCAF20]
YPASLNPNLYLEAPPLPNKGSSPLSSGNPAAIIHSIETRSSRLGGTRFHAAIIFSWSPLRNLWKDGEKIDILFLHA